VGSHLEEGEGAAFRHGSTNSRTQDGRAWPRGRECHRTPRYHNTAQGESMYDPQAEPLLPIRFEWRYGGHQVHLCGSFTRWLETVPMAPSSAAEQVCLPALTAAR
jgi:hypothetical protein